MEWLHRLAQRQLPGPHFLLTFTVPDTLHALLRRHQKLGYGALFAASSESITTLARDPRRLDADACGFFGVLHTWGRQMQYHPHVHYLVPGGAMRRRDARWRPSPAAWFLPVRALSRLFRGAMRARLKAADLLRELPPETWRREWVVQSLAVPDAQRCMRYQAACRA